MSIRAFVPEPARERIRATAVALGTPTQAFRATPDFVLVGGQRCGTTSLFRALVEHPQVVRPRFHKGINYFDINYFRGEGWYRAHLPITRIANASTKRYGPPAFFEASGYYLYHPFAMERLVRDLPEAKIVVMLRDPVERAYSAYQHERARGYEWESFETALALEDERLVGEEGRMRRDPVYESFTHRHHSYRRRGQYAEQLRRVFSLLPRHQVHVMQSESFFSDPTSEFRGLTDFLGLIPFQPDRFDQHNARPRVPMKDQTRSMLTQHYVAHDEALTELLGEVPRWRL